MLNLAILHPTSLANLVVVVGTRHIHQMLFRFVIYNFAELIITTFPASRTTKSNTVHTFQHQGIDNLV